jgi:LysM repeat protein
MRLRILPCLTALILLVAPAAANAAFEHVVAPGESLTSVAAADGLSVAQLAAANGVSPDALLVAGTMLAIPPQTSSPATESATSTTGDGDADSDDPGTATSTTTAGSTSVLRSSAPAGGGSYVVQLGDTLSAIAARAGLSLESLAAANGLDPKSTLLAGSVLSLSGASSPASAGSQPASTAAPSQSASTGGGQYVVQPGDTLSAIAARAGVSVEALAADTGLSLSAPLLAGTVLSLSGAPSTVTDVSQPVSTSTAGATGGPYPTPQTVSASDIGSIADANGVSPSLAAAIGWQESGFNNDLVSSTGAVGVMQIEPGTWSWIGQNLAGSAPLSPYSASDNVRGGVLLLHSLMSATGGDPALAAAGYYQGLQSIQQHGLYSDTQQYVNDVLALRGQFGGP